MSQKPPAACYFSRLQPVADSTDQFTGEFKGYDHKDLADLPPEYRKPTARGRTMPDNSADAGKPAQEEPR